jgi:hypothetical protein
LFVSGTGTDYKPVSLNKLHGKYKYRYMDITKIGKERIALSI